MKDLTQREVREKVRHWLIRLANRIGSGEYYDFGSPIISTFALKNVLIAATRSSIYGYKDGKWVKMSNTDYTTHTVNNDQLSKRREE